MMPVSGRFGIPKSGVLAALRHTASGIVHCRDVELGHRKAGISSHLIPEEGAFRVFLGAVTKVIQQSEPELRLGISLPAEFGPDPHGVREVPGFIGTPAVLRRRRSRRHRGKTEQERAGREPTRPFCR